ncbi:transglycosylase family protein [Streptomyces sp. NRRL S-244]|uniref:transglycosylase family protein n=1 Tax=Streptomyces sp. NRRL S-244 TaxID=1463897 RepID=UPI00068936FD|nr:transglycosylase family protein [Streptomyces sp. NRRL S-244]
MKAASRHLARLAAAALGCAATLTLAPVQAEAASVAAWDRLAQCESTGNWSYYKAGWPYYGGIQITESTWRAFGGLQYAQLPHQATKKQQILIGEKILAGQGVGAWGSCGRDSGIASDHADPYPQPAHAPSRAGVYRPGESVFYVSGVDGGLAGYAGFGVEGDVPLTGDWNGDGKDTFGVYRPSDQTFSFTNDNATVFSSARFGNPGDVPLIGDWDGNGTDTIGVYRPSDQTFSLTNDNRNVAYTLRMGVEGDTPVTGDWNGDGKDTIGVYRPSDQTFYLSDSSTGANVDHRTTFGNPGDVPIKGDWNGDGTDKVGVYRPEASDFFGAAKDSDTVIYQTRFGVPGDKPITGKAW